jgi:protein-tyrosine-phosphatase
MAAGFLRQMAEQTGIAVDVHSAGLSASQGAPISRHSASILQHKGISLQHTSQPATAKLVTWADLIFTMTVNHKRALIQGFPHALDKIHLLKEYVEDDPKVLATIAESESLFSELEMKRVLSHAITAEERQRLWELENQLPNYDIFDPFGGSLADYEQCAMELELQIGKLVRKLEN